MNYFALCVVVFLSAYLVNITYVSVFYHRGLTHRALTLHPWLERWVVFSGTMVTGLDPMAWCCMHRLHHLHSDTKLDPHSPVNGGVFQVLLAQKDHFGLATWGLYRKEEKYTSVMKDSDYKVNWLSCHDLWWVPYATHALLAIALGFVFHGAGIAVAYFFGMMSHPLQGWLVNAFGHHTGYRNFPVADNSRNNIPVALLVMGEGYQNNHHQSPHSANFGYHWWEFDGGYVLCRIGQALGLLTIHQKKPTVTSEPKTPLVPVMPFV